MLRHEEQRAWDDIRCGYGEETGQPARPVPVRLPRSSEPAGQLAAAVAGGCLAVLLVIIGAPVAGLVIAGATIPRWLLWRHGASLDGIVRQPAPTATRDVPLDTEAGRPVRWQS